MTMSGDIPERHPAHPSGGIRLLRVSCANVLLLHWPLPAAALRGSLPQGLDIDCFGGRAWISMTPSVVSGVRPALLPPLPGLSSFLELPVRTYVRYRGEPGLFFFSVDASHAAAVWMGRVVFHLPCFRARMEAAQRADAFTFSSRRTHQGATCGQLECTWRAGPRLPPTGPRDLRHFLTERDRLFTVHRGKIFVSTITREPWILREAELAGFRSNLFEAAGFRTPSERPLAYHADSLSMAMLPLREAESAGEEAGLLDPALSPPPASFVA